MNLKVSVRLRWVPGCRLLLYLYPSHRHERNRYLGGQENLRRRTGSRYVRHGLRGSSTEARSVMDRYSAASSARNAPGIDVGIRALPCVVTTAHDDASRCEKVVRNPQFDRP